jgi:hypothetical protein
VLVNRISLKYQPGKITVSQWDMIKFHTLKQTDWFNPLQLATVSGLTVGKAEMRDFSIDLFVICATV